jgi:LuxR family maltose regulon positive regulatory protein
VQLNSASLFPRDRLFGRIDAALAAPVALLVAPAASGKSTSLRDAFARPGNAALRLDGDPEHAAPEEFLRALGALFAEQLPAMASTVAIPAAQLARGDDAGALAWVLDHLRGVYATVILDDLHHALANPRGAALIAGMIDRTQPRIRWVLATRNADALPVARWMADGVTTLPVDEDDLRITLDELATAARERGSDLGDEELAHLHARMQGWPLGLALALSGDIVPSGDAAGREAVYDAVVELALATRIAPLQDRLFQTALAGRFDLPLLERLDLSPADARELVRAHLVHELAEGAFAYEEPYRVRLLARIDALEDARRARLTQRVAAALEDAGRWGDAVAVLLRAKDAPALADTLERRGFAALDAGEGGTVRDILDAIPEELVVARPRALAVRAALASADDRLDVSEAWFRMAIDAGQDDVRREIVLRYGLDLVRRGRDDAIQLLEAETPRSAGSRWDAPLWGLLGAAYVGAHRTDDARRAARTALSRLHAIDDPALRCRVLHQAAYVALDDHDYASAKDLGERAVAEAERSFVYDVAGRALSVLYVLAVDVDDDAGAARGHLGRLEEIARKAGNDQLLVYALLALYELETIAGNLPALERLDGELRERNLFLDQLASETVLPAQALHASWEGRFEHAYQLLAPGAEKQFDNDRRAQRWAEAAVYAAAAGLRSESVAAMKASREALREVDAADRWALRTNAYLAIAMTLLAHDARARSAIADLRRAARRAGPRFGAMVEAIRALHARWLVDAKEDGLPDAIERLDEVDLGGFGRFLSALPLPDTGRSRVGLLTDVEKRILRLVGSGSTTKEIAADLDRSAHTVDVHIRNICRKIGCSGRRQAVAFAIREGLLDERRTRRV